MLKPQGKAPEGESSCGPSVCVPTIDTRNRMGDNRPPSFDDKKTGKNAKDSRQARLWTGKWTQKDRQDNSFRSRGPS